MRRGMLAELIYSIMILSLAIGAGLSVSQQYRTNSQPLEYETYVADQQAPKLPPWLRQLFLASSAVVTVVLIYTFGKGLVDSLRERDYSGAIMSAVLIAISPLVSLLLGPLLMMIGALFAVLAGSAYLAVWIVVSLERALTRIERRLKKRGRS